MGTHTASHTTNNDVFHATFITGNQTGMKFIPPFMTGTVMKTDMKTGMNSM